MKNILNSYSYASISRGLRYSNSIMIAAQILTISLISLIILQILITNQYSITSLRVQTYISHISVAVILSFLVFMFGRWLASKRNYTVAIYTLSFLLVGINLIVSLIYLDAYFSVSPKPDVSSYPIVSYVTNLSPSITTELFSHLSDILSLTSFLFLWLATANLLKQYRHKLGRVRFLVLMGLPLIYYVYPFQSFFGDPLFPLLQSVPPSFSITYVLIFSATKQVGALLFSFAFLTAYSLINDEHVRKSLLMSAIGIAILVGSIEITPLQYHVYPPYGFITMAFLPLGTYLLFAGILVSAKNISRDAKLRRQFYKRAESQLNLLRAIGISEMEKEIMQVRSLEDNIVVSAPEPETLSDEKVREIIHDVLSELYYSK
ncbi:MAG TPA: hypothetical protein VKA95_02775 [Nitrososphaeraceae archaeon]|nr:hypothetical protein [Nitrososphaeraceae archaeon]